MDNDTIRFIDRLFKDLYKNETVLRHTSGNKAEKFRNINEYLSLLENLHQKASEAEETTKTLKRLYFEKYAIRREDIPDSYYATQERIALERGFGHVSIDAFQRRKLQDEIIDNQKKSLEEWLDYFLSDDSKFYPFWAKYWAFQGMLKLGTYDKEKGMFNERTSKTVAPFADLNREALSKSIDLIISYVNKEEIDDEELENIVKTGSFQNIYPYVLNELLSNNENIKGKNEGIWVKYDQGSDHMLLVNSLQGYNTGWCTAGESTARIQLSMGDFYVYYTLDVNGEYKIPRIAIRMENGKIAEIRGVGKKQNLEPDMEKVVEEKIKEFPDREKYYKKVDDMKKLTDLYNKFEEGQELNAEELRFLYELDSKIEGFGFESDPRIEEILVGRNIRKDHAEIFNCDESQISLEGEEYSSDTIYYCGDIDLRKIETTEGIILPQNINGSLYLNSLVSLDGFSLPKHIGGSLYLNSLETTEGLTLPQHIGEDLYLYSLESAEGLTFPKSVGRDLRLDNLKTGKGLTLPEKIGGSLALSKLEIAEGLILPQTIGGFLDLNIKSAKGITLPRIIGEGLYLGNLETTEGLTLPKIVGGDLYLNIKTANDLILPESVAGDVFLKNLETAQGLVLPKKVGGIIHMDSLKTAEGIVFPTPLTYSILTSFGEIPPDEVNKDKLQSVA